MGIEEKIRNFRDNFEQLRAEIHKAIVGNEEIVELVLVALISNGHVLLEGVPGLGKTYLVKTLSESLNLGFSRIQFTPDLMPADIIGTTVVNEKDGRKVFTFQKGAVFSNILLADEINRATPKTQSALLEAMQERTVTVSGTRHDLPAPFIVLATQNPIEATRNDIIIMKRTLTRIITSPKLRERLQRRLPRKTKFYSVRSSGKRLRVLFEQLATGEDHAKNVK